MRLTTKERLAVAMMAMDESSQTVYEDLISYCEQSGKKPDQLSSRDLLKMIYQLLDDLSSV